MNVGVSVPLPAYSVDVAFVARTAETLGFESLWCAELEASRRELDGLAKQAGRDPSSLGISVHGQAPDRELVRRFHDAGADRVVIRPPAAATEAEMRRALERIAEAVLR